MNINTGTYNFHFTHHYMKVKLQINYDSQNLRHNHAIIRAAKTEILFNIILEKSMLHLPIMSIIRAFILIVFYKVKYH